jgi:hypothetical protein
VHRKGHPVLLKWKSLRPWNFQIISKPWYVSKHRKTTAHWSSIWTSRPNFMMECTQCSLVDWSALRRTIWQPVPCSILSRSFHSDTLYASLRVPPLTTQWFNDSNPYRKPRYLWALYFCNFHKCSVEQRFTKTVLKLNVWRTINQGYIQWAGGWGLSPAWIRHGPINLQGNEFFGNLFSGFENLITLSAILRHLEAEFPL